NALFDGRSRLAFEAAMSAWSGHKAPAAVLGFEIKKSSIRNLFGVFYLSPHYVSRLADAVRYGDEAAGNRWGGFGAFESRLSRHAPGGHFYWERNIKTMFSGSSLSHQPPDSRSRTKLRLDDRILLARAMSLYGRGDLEFEPYFVHAIKEPRVSRIEERKLRLEWSLDKKQWTPAVGFDYLRALAHGYPLQSSEAKDVYFKLRFKPAPGLAVYAKTAYFDVGPALFNSRFLYLSSPELYWRRLTLSSIAYQSLFASYAPRGLRAALAVEQQWDEHLSFWLKWGDTWLDHENASSMPINTAERDDLIAASRWDFKMEVTCKW
ncbi:MAG: hypothetical protein HY747_06370, partial [Elusimicrobia bacterium]|nr:hypothetical protein [Elusimicrobiota bacterium]